MAQQLTPSVVLSGLEFRGSTTDPFCCPIGCGMSGRSPTVHCWIVKALDLTTGSDQALSPLQTHSFLYPVKPSGQSMRIKIVVQRSGLTKIVPDSLISGAARYFPSGGHPVNWGTGASRSLL